MNLQCSFQSPERRALRIAVISDIHSNLEAFDTVIRNLPQYDKLICLGDIVGYGPQPNEVIERLAGLKSTIVLRGNHDHAVVTGVTSGFSENAATAVHWTRKRINQTSLTYLSRLQPSAKTEAEGVSLGLYHGSPQNPLSEYVYPGIAAFSAKRIMDESGARIVLLGHTHVPMNYSLDGGMLGNPGSVGQPRDGDPRASFAVLSVENSGRFSLEIKRIEYNIEKVANAIVKVGLPIFLAERLYTGM